LDIDPVNERVMLPQTKNGEGRIVYLNNLALAALSCIGVGEPKGLIFSGMVPEAVSVAFARACRKVGVADFRFHDLRHTAASWMRMKGADIHTVA
jgi:integrase